MRTDITQTYHRHKRKGGTKSKRRRGRASERERARERKVDRKTDRQTDRQGAQRAGPELSACKSLAE